MLKLPTLVLVAAALAGFVSAQSGRPAAKPATPPAVDMGPVTCAEASKSLAAIQAAFEGTLGIKAQTPIGIPLSTTLATRDQVLKEFGRMEKLFEPYYTLKPRTQYCNPAVIKFPGQDKATATRLVKLGFLEPVSPFVVGPSDNMTVEQFCNALGFFVERWCDMTHLPSIKWSPELQHQAPMPKPPFGLRAPTRSGASRRPASS